MNRSHRAAVAGTLAFAMSASLASCRGGEDSKVDATSGGTIPVTSILDETGPLSGYGLAMQDATKLSIDDINQNGGVLGKQLVLTDEDSKSDEANYTVLARDAATSDAAVVMGGITSASREAIRPIFHQADKLYFYNVLYEGGVCDKNAFVTGETPNQQLQPLLEWAAAQGLKKWYVLAANYNYGQISASWVEEYAAENGAEIVGGPSFFDLTVSDFATEVPKIENSGADLIVSLLVGPGHLNFYKQWTATGLNEKTTIVSPSYGLGAEQVALGTDGTGILNAYPYMPSTGAEDSLNQAWTDAGIENIITPGAVSTWNAWHLWAAAVEEAGTTDRDDVTAALEGGVSYDGPAGSVTYDPQTHHAVLPMSLWKDTGTGEMELVELLSDSAQPTFEQSKCDLIEDPDQNEQFTP
jgi:urea transport system substrate-binding protein